ncbi:uncharacterized protein SPSK_03749 [Sporothrix schenckii 1099-18]|uniref:Uncharacterized protein n=1 Tax=Sporothrix schenckii 1099-18 TaxID=1397361 RepID=A0A0F2LZ42_SPOSC|nr:uncharacterized protein SPSK_03749 [Sporothrix schenckii 1099-18]KJR82099.1 hypothetical protein SPSK_03749 [Sporothrix schenckii 1099-18]
MFIDSAEEEQSCFPYTNADVRHKHALRRRRQGEEGPAARGCLGTILTKEVNVPHVLGVHGIVRNTPLEDGGINNVK